LLPAADTIAYQRANHLSRSRPASTDDDFADLIRLLPAGDEEAADELVGQYDGVMCRVLHLRLRDPCFRHVFDRQQQT
jgi:hypothetical protein